MDDNTVMTPDQFTEWRLAMKISATRAAELLGISRQTVHQYTKGVFVIPKPVELACAALQVGINGYPPTFARIVQIGSELSSVDPDDVFVMAAPFSGAPGMPHD